MDLLLQVLNSLTFCGSIPYAFVAEYFWHAVTDFSSSETLSSTGSNWLLLSETTVFCYLYYFMDIWPWYGISQCYTQTWASQVVQW